MSLLAYYVHHWSPFIVEFGGGFGLRWYGTAYLVGFGVAYLLLRWFARHGYSQLPEAKVGEFITGVALFGVLLGGRLGYALFYDLQDTLHDPLRLFKVWEGGMASHGGILGIVLYTLWYAWRHKLSWTGLGDNLVVAAPIGIFFGRLANFINGELYGRATQVPWAVQFPKEIYENRELAINVVEGLQTAGVAPVPTTLENIVTASETSAPVREVLAQYLTPRHPSQLYEAFLEGALLFAVLWFMRTRLRLPEGVVTGAFFLGYAVVRILGEEFRQPDAGIAFTLGLTRGQFLSLFLILIGLAFVVTGWIRKRPSPHPALRES